MKATGRILHIDFSHPVVHGKSTLVSLRAKVFTSMAVSLLQKNPSPSPLRFVLRLGLPV